MKSRAVVLAMVQITVIIGCKTRSGQNTQLLASSSEPLTAIVEAPLKRVSSKPQPVWINNDCTKDEQAFYFIEYGEGRNQATATQQALIEARKSALLCIFGGTIEFSSETAETAKDSSYSGSTKVRVNSDNVDWSGFEKVVGMDFFPFDERDVIYVQYRWPIAKIDTSKKRLAAIAEQIEKNKALASQVEATKALVREQSELIDRQKQELEKAQKQELEIQSLKKETEAARLKLRKIGAKQRVESEELVSLFMEIPCRLTIRELERQFNCA